MKINESDNRLQVSNFSPVLNLLVVPENNIKSIVYSSIDSILFLKLEDV